MSYFFLGLLSYNLVSAFCIDIFAIKGANM